ncbi:MAG: hypothetical protein ACR2ID_01970 [Chthoniobacterales bacterium]
MNQKTSFCLILMTAWLTTASGLAAEGVEKTLRLEVQPTEQTSIFAPLSSAAQTEDVRAVAEPALIPEMRVEYLLLIGIALLAAMQRFTKQYRGRV